MEIQSGIKTKWQKVLTQALEGERTSWVILELVLEG